MLQRITLRNVAIAAIVAFVVYGEYVVWFKSPAAQISAICDEFRALKTAIVERSREPFRLIDEAAAAEPVRLVNKAVRVCDGLPEAVDVKESTIR